MKTAIVILLACVAGFQVAGLVGRGLAAQQSAAAVAAQAYPQESR